MKLLVLYEELAGYFLSCIKQFIADSQGEVLIIASPPNQIAPFQFQDLTGLRVVSREKHSEEELIKMIASFSPDIIMCGGWKRKFYRKVARQFSHTIPVVLGFDNPWLGTLRQRALTALAGPSIRRSFTHAWVPGERQMQFARRLGFREDRIISRAYCADLSTFDQYYEEIREKKSVSFPRRFIYSGRYAKVKDVELLWDVFREFKAEAGPDWELMCLGKGEITPAEIPGIYHLGFIQPEKMKEVLQQTSFFILPSNFEPWGVVVHEFAAAGFPMILSSAVGAGEAFLEQGKNGFVFPSGNKAALKECMLKMAKQSQEEYAKMSEHSHTLAMKVNPSAWAKVLIDLALKQKKNVRH